MRNRVVITLLLIAGFIFVLACGLLAGGGIVYAMTRLGVLPEQADALPTRTPSRGVDRENGILIETVDPESGAAQAGVVRGDILLEVDGQKVNRMGDLDELLEGKNPGDTVSLTVLHGDDLRVLSATLSDRGDRAYLGLRPRSEDRRVRVGMKGAIIVEVLPDSPAETAGLQMGDLILAIDGQEISQENDLADAISMYNPGDRIEIEVLSLQGGGDKREVELILGSHPDDQEKAYLGVRYQAMPGAIDFQDEDFRFEDFPFDEDRFRLDELPFDVPPDFDFGPFLPLLPGRPGGFSGVIVGSVIPDGPAAEADLREGDVIHSINGEPVESPEQLREIIGSLNPGEVIRVGVYHPGEELTELEVTLGENPDRAGAAYLGIRLGGTFRFNQRREGPQSEGG